ncbi:MAG: hypothetical protein AB1798_12610 [Spirochaetota bacterium]
MAGGGFMLLFLVKKTFFDFWDNMFRIVIMNLGFIVLIGACLYLPYLLSFNTVIAFIGAAIGIIVLNIYTGAASMAAREIADYKTPGFADFLNFVKEIWKSSLVFSGITIVQLVILFIAFPFYLSMGGIPGLIAMSIIFWVSVVWWLASQFFFPIRTRLDSNPKKVLKKCLIVFFDNSGFSIVLGFGSILILVVSFFTALLLPGISCILLWQQVGLKLRLYKYDFLEKNPDANRKRIPWDVLLIDDRERVGHRTLKGMIFPWKE